MAEGRGRPIKSIYEVSSIDQSRKIHSDIEPIPTVIFKWDQKAQKLA